MNRPIRAEMIRKGLIRPCIPTPLVKNENGDWEVRPIVLVFDD